MPSYRLDLAPLRPLLTQRRDKTTELEQPQDVALRYDAVVPFPPVPPVDCDRAGPGG